MQVSVIGPFLEHGWAVVETKAVLALPVLAPVVDERAEEILPRDAFSNQDLGLGITRSEFPYVRGAYSVEHLLQGCRAPQFFLRDVVEAFVGCIRPEEKAVTFPENARIDFKHDPVAHVDHALSFAVEHSVIR
jgi:hypothetical protein